MMEIERVNDATQIFTLARLAYEIWPECYAQLLSKEQIDYMVDKFQSEDAIKEQIEKEGYEYYFVSENKHIAGFAGIKPEDGRLFLSKLYIRKTMRNMGFGTFLVQKFEQICREKGLKYIYLTVNRGNEDAIAVYKRRGFYIEKDAVQDIGNGFVMDDYVMRKDVAD